MARGQDWRANFEPAKALSATQTANFLSSVRTPTQRRGGIPLQPNELVSKHKLSSCQCSEVGSSKFSDVSATPGPRQLRGTCVKVGSFPRNPDNGSCVLYARAALPHMGAGRHLFDVYENRYGTGTGANKWEYIAFSCTASRAQYIILLT